MTCLLVICVLKVWFYLWKVQDLRETKAVMKERSIVEKQFADSELTGKYLTRKIDDNTFINFADLILNNLENAEENISKIRTSLSILKDGQAVFTNLEKLYLYRYVFCKAKFSDEKIKLSIKKIEAIPEKVVLERHETEAEAREYFGEELENIAEYCYL